MAVIPEKPPFPSRPNLGVDYSLSHPEADVEYWEAPNEAGGNRNKSSRRSTPTIFRGNQRHRRLQATPCGFQRFKLKHVRAVYIPPFRFIASFLIIWCRANAPEVMKPGATVLIQSIGNDIDAATTVREFPFLLQLDFIEFIECEVRYDRSVGSPLDLNTENRICLGCDNIVAKI